MSGGWGCPHDDDGNCAKRDRPCDPGGEGCVLEERMKKGAEKEQMPEGGGKEGR